MAHRGQEFESGTVRRLDGMFKVKGVNLWPSHVEAVLFSMANVRDYRVRITLDPQGRETVKMDVLIQPQGGIAGPRCARGIDAAA